ncbi:MAG: radical SAM protein [Clostridia bacterium]|nr:radical SAM protein [Clostridia bacterium]
MSGFSAIGIGRHRIGVDGEGVTTLVGGYGCPLDCRYCLNPQCNRGKPSLTLSANELLERLKIDNLYFEATNGGITFGGGEPLLQAAFIRDFILRCRDEGYRWRFWLETCLAVPGEALDAVDDLIDGFIVDVKDMNPAIYTAYTSRSPNRMLANLRTLAERCPEKVIVRLPLIEGFNTPEDVERSADTVCAMGFTRLDRFTYQTKIGK